MQKEMGKGTKDRMSRREGSVSVMQMEGMCGSVVGTHSVGEQEPVMESLVIKKNIYFILRAKEHIYDFFYKYFLNVLKEYVLFVDSIKKNTQRSKKKAIYIVFLPPKENSC